MCKKQKFYVYFSEYYFGQNSIRYLRWYVYELVCSQAHINAIPSSILKIIHRNMSYLNQAYVIL